MLAVAVVLVVLILNRGDRDERRIRRNLSTLESLVEEKGKESLVQALVRARKIASFFTADCRIKVKGPVPGIKGKDALISTTCQVRGMASRIGLKLSDISIVVEEDRTRAKTTLTAVATAASSALGGKEIYPCELEIKWKRVGREWKIEAVRSMDILR